MAFKATVSVGAYADSAYEYMLKQWLLSGRTDTRARDLCMISPLSKVSDPDLSNA
jgi:mannosyl-oligosaccharide alpha-1,2-mannosidase